MHYIGDAYYLYIFKMKSILTSIAFLILTLSAIAQPSGPTCIPSTWDGVGNVIPTDAHAFFCMTPEAPKGTYIYWDAFNDNPVETQVGVSPDDFAEWNWNNIYGMKGRYGINFPNYLGDGDTLSAQVFETKFNSSGSNDLQTPASQTFNFYGGNYKFNKFYVQSGTTVKVHSGASITLESALVVEWGAVLEIMPGATVLLKSSRDNMCVTNVSGVIDGYLSKEIYFDVSDNWQTLNDPELRFVMNPALYEVDLHQAALDIQAATTVQLANSVQQPTVQIGYWGHQYFELVPDDYVEYDFAADHTYENSSAGDLEISPDTPNLPRLVHGTVSLATDGFSVSDVLNQEFEVKTMSQGAMHYNYNEGVGILPILPPTVNVGTTDAELMEYWLNNEDITGFANSEIGLNSDLSEVAKTPIGMNRPFVVSLRGMHNTLDDFEITVTGRFQTSFTMAVGNDAYDNFSVGVPYPNATATYNANPVELELDQQYSAFFENTVTLDPPLSLLTGVDVYSRTGGDDFSNYRGIDMSGLNPINNNTGNYLDTYFTLFQLFGLGIGTQLTLYDMVPIISRMDERKFDTDSETGLIYEKTVGASYPLPVANLVIFDDTAPQYPGIEVVDIYNISDMRIWNALGDTIRPDEMLAYNFNNPLNPQELNGIEFPYGAGFETFDQDWYNKGGYAHTGGGQYGGNELFDTVFADMTNPVIYRKTDMVFRDNVAEMKSIAESRVPVGPGNGPDVFYDWSIEELNDMNEFSLLRLGAVTSNEDTLNLAILPLSTDVSYGSLTADLFETSVGVNPMCYIRNPREDYITSRRWGAYGRNINDPMDTLTLVVDFDAIKYHTSGMPIVKYFIDAPVKQRGNCGLNGENLVSITSPGSNQYTWEDTWELEVTPSEYSEPNPDSPTNEYGTLWTQEFFYTPFGGDVNGDGCVTVADLIVLLGLFDTPADASPVATALDLNCDGNITTSDLLAFLASFGTCIEDVVGINEMPDIVEERIEYYFVNDWNNNHVEYDIINDYPGFTAAQRQFLNEYPRQKRISIVDDLGMVIKRKEDDRLFWWQDVAPDYKIQLQSKFPTSAQLDTTSARINTGISDFDTPSYRIYVEWYDPVTGFPGIDGKISHICLGCTEDPNALFTTRPTFVAN